MIFLNEEIEISLKKMFLIFNFNCNDENKKGDLWAALFYHDIQKTYASTISASGAFFFTEAIPFSIASTELYISLLPIT